MKLMITNTLERKKVPFTPIDPSHVRMYVCGPTVYDYAHVGNARPAVVFDVVARLMRRLYPRLTHVANITDIDDKINARARESGRSIGEITDETAAAYRADMDAIGVKKPDEEPRATHHIAPMIAMAERLIALGHAYEADGHVLFNVRSMPEYGELSRRDRDEMVAGARVEVAPYKRDPADFVIWKPSDAETPGWDSPWGRGRPGWHIECSAMAEAYLGEEFDIHGGGLDLIFPHHENEIAQSRCAHGTKTMAKYWMHNGFVTVEGEKMSKSLGNFYTVHDLLEEWPGEVIRFLLLSAHYRAPLDFSQAGLRESKVRLDKMYKALLRSKKAGLELRSDDDIDLPVLAALCDDINTPLAISELHQLANDVHINLDMGREEGAARSLVRLVAGGALLGLLQADPEAWFQDGGTGDLDAAAIEQLIVDRANARKAKDFAEADRIRDTLKDQGIELEDGPQGTSWKRG
jgi:cysteinyl-tRNA synthetase